MRLSSAEFAFQTDPGVGSILLSPRGLNPEASYSVTSVDSGPIGQASGADLIEQGVEIVASPSTAGHLLIFRMTTLQWAAARASARKR